MFWCRSVCLGDVRSGRYGEVLSVWLGCVLVRHGSRGTSCYVEFRQGVASFGSQVMLSPGQVRYVEVWCRKVRQLWTVWVRYVIARSRVLWQLSHVLVGQASVGRVLFCYGRAVKASSVEVR